MIELEIPGWKSLHLAHLVLDVNGTLALDGALLPVVVDRIERLRRTLDIYLLSADTYGQLDGVAAELGVRGERLRPRESEADQKAGFVRALGSTEVVAIGNGANDVGMLEEAALGIAVFGHEGLATVALRTADVVAASIEEALNLLAHPRRLVATLRR